MTGPYNNNPGQNEVLKIRSVSRVEQILLSGQWKEKTTVIPSLQRIEENLPLSSKPYEIMKKNVQFHR